MGDKKSNPAINSRGGGNLRGAGQRIRAIEEKGRVNRLIDGSLKKALKNDS
jgi:hypothetical protein